MNQHTKIALILMVFTLSSLTYGSLFLRNLGFTRKIAAPALTLAGAALVGYHEHGWRKAHKQIAIESKNKQQLQENSDNFRHMESIYETLRTAIPTNRAIQLLETKRTKHYRFAVFSRIRYGSLNKAIAALHQQKK